MNNHIYFIRFLPILILVILLVKFLLPNSKKKFLKYQAILPTSKISSIAMGLVEIEGCLEMIEPLRAPESGEECIGYYHTIEEVTKKTDGKYEYNLIQKNSKCNTFNIIDSTGKIEVIPEGIEFFFIETTNIISNSNKRHKEVLIKNGEKKLIIGYADKENNKTVIRKNKTYKLLGITTSERISLWNKYQFLWQSFLIITYIISIIIAFIILN